MLSLRLLGGLPRAPRVPARSHRSVPTRPDGPNPGRGEFILNATTEAIRIACLNHLRRSRIRIAAGVMPGGGGVPGANRIPMGKTPRTCRSIMRAQYGSVPQRSRVAWWRSRSPPINLPAATMQLAPRLGRQPPCRTRRQGSRWVRTGGNQLRVRRRGEGQGDDGANRRPDDRCRMPAYAPWPTFIDRPPSIVSDGATDRPALYHRRSRARPAARAT